MEVKEEILVFAVSLSFKSLAISIISYLNKVFVTKVRFVIETEPCLTSTILFLSTPDRSLDMVGPSRPLPLYGRV